MSQGTAKKGVEKGRVRVAQASATPASDPPAQRVRALMEAEGGIDEGHEQEGRRRVGEHGGGREEEVGRDEEQRQGEERRPLAEDPARHAEREWHGEGRRKRRDPGHGAEELADREGGGMAREVDPVHLPGVHDELIVEKGSEGRGQRRHVDAARGEELGHEGIGMLIVTDGGILQEPESHQGDEQEGERGGAGDHGRRHLRRGSARRAVEGREQTGTQPRAREPR